MNSGRLATAFFITLVISGIIVLWMNHGNSKGHVAAAPVPKSQYVAAAANLEANQVIRAENLRLIDWPADHPLPGAFNNAQALIGRVIMFPVAEGEPIIERQLSTPGTGSGITVKIPNGMRAISLHSDDVIGVAGFLLPGTHVDVLVTLHPTSNNQDPFTFTVLQDAEVLAAGQKIEPDPEGKPATATVVTLLVKPEDAERIVLASAQGAVHFVLRNGVDRDEFKGPPALLAQLSGIAPPSSAKAAAVPKSAQMPAVVKHYSVETILGTKQRMDDFQ
jgi:pilus assembly protein CpaB